MTLYVMDSTKRGGPFGVHSALPAMFKALRADLLRACGWVDCSNCDGRVCMACVLRHMHDSCEDEACPDCVDGVVPSDEMVKAAADSLDSVEQDWPTWEQDTRAALVAAARTIGKTE